MPLESSHLRRLAALNLPPETMAEVLSIIADAIAIDEARRAANAARQRALRIRDSHSDNECDELRDSHVSKEGPQTPIENTTPVEPTNTRARKATRIPPDWKPKPNVFELGRNLGFRDEEILRELDEKMRDYFTAKSGKDATKHDWDATARNWLRRAADDRKRWNGSPGKPSPGQTMRDAIRDVGEHVRSHGKAPGRVS